MALTVNSFVLHAWGSRFAITLFSLSLSLSVLTLWMLVHLVQHNTNNKHVMRLALLQLGDLHVSKLLFLIARFGREGRKLFSFFGFFLFVWLKLRGFVFINRAQIVDGIL